MINVANKNNLKDLVKLACELWPNSDREQIYNEYNELINSKNNIFFLAYCDEIAIGFAHASLRFDYVEGATSSPVGYLEGIYVEIPYRKKGIAKELLNHCEGWASRLNAKEFASDCELTNENSYKFHKAIGFNETNRIICFMKKL